MRALLLAAVTLAPVTALVAGPRPVAHAQDAAKKSDARGDSPPRRDDGPRKDPRGKIGISPYMEAVAKGERSFAAHDLPNAIAAFQDATKMDGNAMLAFYRLGEAQLASNRPDEARATWRAALSKKGADALKGKVLFVLADLHERRGQWQDAKDAWTAYSAFLETTPEVRGYPATAAARQKAIARRVKDERDYGAVKERILAREAERKTSPVPNAKKEDPGRGPR